MKILFILIMMFMKNKSIWLDVKNKALKRVTKDLECDTLIVGGGITGLSTLYQLRKENVDALLVERNRCGEGVTARSTAKITYLQEKIYRNIRRFGSIDKAKTYLESQITAVRELKKIIEKESILCDLKSSSSILFTNEEKNKEMLIEEYNFLKDAGVKVEWEENQQDFKYAIKVGDTYMFHPVKYVLSLKNILQDYIYENSKVERIIRDNSLYNCYVNGKVIKAKRVVIATHYPYFILPLFMPLKNHPETSYVGAKKINSFKNINAINIDTPTISYRYHESDDKNYLIYLFNSYLTPDIKSIKNNFEDLKKKNDFDYIWSNKDIITNDYLPLVGRIDEDEDGLLVACGYNTWGMTNATLAGMILCDIILKKHNKYIQLFKPDRLLNWNKVVRFFPDAYGSIKAIVKSGNGNVNNQNVIYTTIGDKNVAVYRDEKGMDHIVLNRCPHMKCGLVFNEVEKTWDCLCHGSRYDIDGKCIEGPSNYDITFEVGDTREEK